MSKYEAVIGLEIHAQLKTESKIFSADRNSFGAADNENVSVVSLGLPGTLPVFNAHALKLAALAGRMLNSQIAHRSVFARKNYFYPDLPKGYQISQFDQPICVGGHVEFLVDDEVCKVELTRAHLEEDAGKSTHHGEYSLMNFNRAGVPLLEIVSEPQLRSAREAAEYARMIKTLLQYVDVCDGNLEEGSLRCDCNVSIRPQGEQELGRRVELKNINSFRFIEKAIDFEIQRQVALVESGAVIEQETRLYDSSKNKTYSMRKKEDSQDYRYFPDPDILPIEISEDFLEEIERSLPERPMSKYQRFCQDLGVSSADADFLIKSRSLSEYFEAVVKQTGNPKSALSWVIGELQSYLNEKSLEIDECPVSAERLSELIQFIDKKVISGKIAKNLFEKMWTEGESAGVLIEREGLSQITDESELHNLANEIVKSFPDQVEEFRGGKEKVLGFFMGQVMKKSGGRANPDRVREIILQLLKGTK